MILLHPQIIQHKLSVIRNVPTALTLMDAFEKGQLHKAQLLQEQSIDMIRLLGKYGGIATGKAILAAMVLGAEGVQIGTRFVASIESSAHHNFKQAVVSLQEGDTMLSMKKVVPVRLIKNDFQKRVQDAEDRGATREELEQILGRARAKKGMYEGDMVEGELEIGQIASFVKEIKPAGEILREIWDEFNAAKNGVATL